MKLTLISHALCPYVQRAVIALEEKHVEFERKDIDLNAKPDWFLALSPLGKTPLLLAGDQAIFESAVICEYLEDTVAPALHPSDPLWRARHRAWIEFASATLNAIGIFYTATDDAGYRASTKALTEKFRQIELALAVGSGPYFDGAQFSLVDAAFAPVFRYFEVFDQASGVELFGATPKVRAWRAALAQRRSVQAAVAPDYPERLRRFVIGKNGILGQRMVETLHEKIDAA